MRRRLPGNGAVGLSGQCLGPVIVVLLVIVVILQVAVLIPGGEDMPEHSALPATAATALFTASPDVAGVGAPLALLRSDTPLPIGPDMRAKCVELLANADVPPQTSVAEGGFFSQFFQDWFLYHNYYRGMRYGAGVFVEVGSNDPEYLSNTLFFEQCLGWRGLCIEPNPRYHSKIRETRQCTLVPNCVSEERKTLQFADEMGLSHAVGPASGGNGGLGRGEGSDGSSGGKVFEAECLPLGDILREHGVTHADYLSVDIEGAEYDALKKFPFDEFDIRAIDIETNQQETSVLDALLGPHRYTRVAHLYIDDIWIKHDLPASLYPRDKVFMVSDCVPKGDLWTTLSKAAVKAVSDTHAEIMANR